MAGIIGLSCHFGDSTTKGAWCCMPRFDLVSEPWIPVRDEAGELREVSLEQALLQANRLLRLEDSSPLVEASIHRLLVAVLHRALQGPARPPDRVELWRLGRFPHEPIRSYLHRYRQRFDLFDPATPFYQIPDLPADDPLPWTKLEPQRSSGNNPALFDHTFDDRPPPATPAAAARALLVHQSFTPGGLIRRLGVTAGKSAPLATAAVFIPLGANLFETLTFALVPYQPGGDVPIWERPPLRATDVANERTREGLAGRTRVYTWLSRAVKLLPEPDGTVLTMAYGPGMVPVEDMPYSDPMCAYVSTESGARRPARLSLDRAFWRDFDALLPPDADVPDPSLAKVPQVLTNARELLMLSGRQAVTLPLAVIGQVTDQAKVLATRREVYPYPLAALEAQTAVLITGALRSAESVGQELRAAGWAACNALLSPGGRSTPAEEVRRLLQSLPLMSHFWSQLERAFVEFLGQVASPTPEQAMQHWWTALGQAVRDAWRATERAVGAGPRHLRAVQAAETRVAALLSELTEGVVA